MCISWEITWVNKCILVFRKCKLKTQWNNIHIPKLLKFKRWQPNINKNIDHPFGILLVGVLNDRATLKKVLAASYKRNHTVNVPLCLASFKSSLYKFMHISQLLNCLVTQKLTVLREIQWNLESLQCITHNIQCAIKKE